MAKIFIKANVFKINTFSFYKITHTIYNMKLHLSMIAILFLVLTDLADYHLTLYAKLLILNNGRSLILYSLLKLLKLMDMDYFLHRNLNFKSKFLIFIY